MWFLGAGSSVGAGLPTAYTLTWEFKRQLYCTAHKIPLSYFPSLDDKTAQIRIQSYFDGHPGYPSLGADEEYSFYFEKYLPDDGDRRRFLDARLRGLKPSYGHLCCGALLTLNKVQIVWTTNFDPLVEQAVSQKIIIEKLSQGLTVVGLECPHKVVDIFRDERWPVLVKLHGDYGYRKLKNIGPELGKQDETFRLSLKEQCGRRGLAVVGYSGRDESVMSTLSDALSTSDPYPHGLFWFVRSGDALHPAVLSLLEAARTKKCQAGYIEVGSFDELMADLFLPYYDDLPDLRDFLKAQRQRRHSAILSYTGRPGPILRTNAFEIVKYPSNFKVFQSDIGGAKAVKEVVAQYGSRIAAGRKKVGVIALGNRGDLAKAFASFGPKEFDLFPVSLRHLGYEDSQEKGIFYSAICQAFANQTGLLRAQIRKGRTLYLPSIDILTKDERQRFQQLSIEPVRIVRSDRLTIHEGITLSIEYRNEHLWLLIEPTLMVTRDGTTPYTDDDRSDIGREDLIKRYNKKANDLLSLWIDFLTARCGKPIRLFFPTEAETETIFEISESTAFARPK